MLYILLFIIWDGHSDHKVIYLMFCLPWDASLQISSTMVYGNLHSGQGTAANHEVPSLKLISTVNSFGGPGQATPSGAQLPSCKVEIIMLTCFTRLLPGFQQVYTSELLWTLKNAIQMLNIIILNKTFCKPLDLVFTPSCLSRQICKLQNLF